MIAVLNGFNGLRVSRSGHNLSRYQFVTNKRNDMGEAKMRGEFEKRLKEAIIRDQEKARRTEENRPKPLQRKITALAVMAAVATPYLTK